MLNSDRLGKIDNTPTSYNSLPSAGKGKLVRKEKLKFKIIFLKKYT